MPSIAMPGLCVRCLGDKRVYYEWPA